jgi:hypothetical protein
MSGTGEAKKSEGDKQNLKPITNEKSTPLGLPSDAAARDTEREFQTQEPGGGA